MYIADLYVKPRTARSSVMRKLLAHTAKAGTEKGCRFIRSDVDISDEAIDGVFRDSGFMRQPRHHMMFLEREEFEMLSTNQT
jgi:ribosomal protein S18 acetylase RimI-like enzyme